MRWNSLAVTNNASNSTYFFLYSLLFLLFSVFVFASFFVYAVTRARALPRKVIRTHRNDPTQCQREMTTNFFFFTLHWYPSNLACKWLSLATRYVYLLLHYYLVISDWFNHVVARYTPSYVHCTRLSIRTVQLWVGIFHFFFFFILLILFACRPSFFFFSARIMYLTDVCSKSMQYTCIVFVKRFDFDYSSKIRCDYAYINAQSMQCKIPQLSRILSN